MAVSLPRIPLAYNQICKVQMECARMTCAGRWRADRIRLSLNYGRPILLPDLSALTDGALLLQHPLSNLMDSRLASVNEVYAMRSETTNDPVTASR